MKYTAKSLPGWVRFRTREREREPYTVETLSEHMMRRMIDATLAARVGSLASSVTRNNALLMRLQSRGRE